MKNHSQFFIISDILPRGKAYPGFITGAMHNHPVVRGLQHKPSGLYAPPEQEKKKRSCPRFYPGA